ncbi:RHS repeat-associated core domain-containing protein [Amycolatopsis xylanica]|uniref:RHS repeat-associated core domain-containing protein n=1 Tax=Amycolatopsis xylanica TaxID=589385 RepID=A0A1H3CNT3_9PSEU|nr:RHS repeat-associated core domain-containing protein [Amycolatopsis xylanica]SDX55813.1 RHS repeat-associated core domain-containing protein [Amycolatopsis xylanica]
MSNPLVAAPTDSTKAYSGVVLLESAFDLKQAIESGDWAGVALGAVGAALDALGAVLDPFGTILAAGVGWLLEHVGPLKEALDALAGSPDAVKAHSETWKNVATELGSISDDLKAMVAADTTAWKGEAADAYRKQAADVEALLKTTKEAAEGASSGVKTAGEVVAAVRMLVRDIIAEVVGHMISWALQVLFTLGIGLAWVVPQVVTEVAKTAAKIANLTKRLVHALKALAPLLKKATGLFDDVAKQLKGIKGGKPGPSGKPGDLPPPPKQPPPPRGGDGSTGPQSAPKDPPPNTTRGGGESTSPSGAPKDPPPPPPVKNDPPPPPPATKSDPPPPPPPPVKQPDPPPLNRGGNESTTPSGGKNDPAKTKDPDNKPCEFDPIDVATGDVLLSEVDLVVPGVLGGLIAREHVSSYRDGRWFGPSWTSLVDERLIFDAGVVRYYSADAMVLTFPIPLPGKASTAVYGPPRTLEADGDGYLITDPGRGLLRRFTRAGQDEFLLREVHADNDELVILDRAPDGAPTVLSHSGGARIAFETAAGRVRSVRALAPGGDVPVARYEYDQNGHLSLRANSTPRPARYDHDAEGRVRGWTDHNGTWYRYVYDESGRCVRTVGDGGYLDGSLSYADGRTVTTDSLGHQKIFEFDAAGNVVSETDKLGGVTRSEWGPHDLLLARTDQLGRRTEFEHDAAGTLVAVIRPDGSRVVITAWTEAGLEIEVTDGERVYTRSYPGSFDPYTQPLGVFQDIDEVPAPDGESADVDVDLFGRPRVLRKPSGQVTLAWTVEGKLRTTVGADGARQQWTYDGEGGEVSHTDALNRVAVAEHGPFGVLTATTDPVGARTTRRFDTELRLLAVTNPAGRTWEFGYDAEGRLLSQSDFDGRITRCAYDAAGQLVHLINAAGERVEFSYDQLGNIRERISAAGAETYQHDPVGKLVRATSPDTELALEHDLDGRVVRSTISGRTTTFGYTGDTDTDRRSPSGVDVHWGRTGDVDTLTVAGTELTLHRDAAGRQVAVTVGANPLVQQEFDAAGRLAAQRTPAGPRRYHRRPDGSVMSREDPGGGARYEFDPVGRITAVHTHGGTERYAYDVTGNLIAASPGLAHYVTDAQGRLVQRTVGDLVWTFGWDAQDHLTGVRTPDGAQWRYRYDALDRRVAKQRLDAAGGIAEQVDFAWDGNTLIEASHSAGHTFTWVYHPDDGKPVAQVVTSPDGTARVSVVVTDDVGTPVELIAADAGAVSPVRTSLWGLTGDGAVTPLRFPGQYFDAETGLHYNVFRYYDPRNARYLSADPLGLDPAPNPLTYVADPLLACDPLGLTWGGGGSGSARLAAKYVQQQADAAKQAAQAAAAAAAGPNPTAVAAAQSATGKCKKKPSNSGNHFQPYPQTAPKKGSGGTSSSGPKVPKGPKDPDSGRWESQGGATSSGKQTLDGSPIGRNADWSPKPGHLTDVEDLLKTKHKDYSPELQNALDKVNGYKPSNPPTGTAQWVKGHLQNDNLDGPGTKDNMTPLTQTANKNMSQGFERYVKESNDHLRLIKSEVPNDNKLAQIPGIDPSQYDKVRNDLKDLKLNYSVDASTGSGGLKFPNSPNEFERSIRDHLELKAGYEGVTPDVQKYLDFRYGPGYLHEFPPNGQKMDTLTGEMTDLPSPPGSPMSLT